MKLALAVLLLTSTATAQIASEPPFVGTDSDSLENKTFVGASACFTERVFNGQADFCGLSSQPVSLTSWNVNCTIVPHGGTTFISSKITGYSVTFDQPVSRFGGWFTQNYTSSGGVADFYDAAGALLASLPIVAPNDCIWNWNGWRATGPAGIARVDLIGNDPSGGLLSVDDLEADFSPPGTLQGTPDRISVSSGGAQILTLDLDDGHAGKSYLILGSVSGTAPGFPYGGALVPLNPDPYTIYVLLNPNTPLLNGNAGSLNSFGQATAVFTLPAASDPALVGLTLHHAGFAIELASGVFVLPEVSNAVPLTLDP